MFYGNPCILAHLNIILLLGLRFDYIFGFSIFSFCSVHTCRVHPPTGDVAREWIRRMLTLISVCISTIDCMISVLVLVPLVKVVVVTLVSLFLVGTDGEKALIDAFSHKFHLSRHLTCFIYVHRNIKQVPGQLHTHNGHAQWGSKGVPVVHFQ